MTPDNIDTEALRAARERLECHIDSRAESAAGGGPRLWSSVLVADLRLVLDALREAEVERLRAAQTYLDVVFGGPPDHESGRFVECENPEGFSVNAGEWIDRGNGLWALRISMRGDAALLAQVEKLRSLASHALKWLALPGSTVDERLLADDISAALRGEEAPRG